MRINRDTVLIGQRVILVPYEEKHVDKYHKWMESEELREMTASERLTREQEYEMQRSWREDEDKCTFIVVSKEKHEECGDEIASMIGDVNIFVNSFDEEPIGEVELMIAEEASRGKGLGSEIVSIMLQYAMDRLKLSHFEVKISDDNARSSKLFQRLGFEESSYSEVFRERTFKFNNSKTEDLKNLASYDELSYFNWTKK
uniref:N-acetyltransferase 9-like protein n=1 Tax=Steinernema glaseri TaxID=37863 RepID=A0A1I7Z211_9BILA